MIEEVKKIEYIICSNVNGDKESCQKTLCEGCSFKLPRLKEASEQICQLFESKPESLEEFFAQNHAELDTIMMDVLKQVASILKKKYEADMEHLSHLVDDVIHLEEKVKSKDAECQERVERIFREIDQYGIMFHDTDICRFWQALKKKELK